MNILAIDTSTEACSVALSRDDGAIFHEFEIAPRQHMRLLPEMMDRVMAASDLQKSMLSHCAFSNGPGAFSGIRIAAAQAQGIALALNIKLVPVSTLAVLAQVCLDRTDYDNVLVALDARMQELYWAVYQRGGDGCAGLVGSERLSSPGEVAIDSTIEFGGGHGWLDELRDAAGFPVDRGLFPDARSLLKLARKAIDRDLAVDAGQISINYLRNQVAEKSRT